MDMQASVAEPGQRHLFSEKSGNAQTKAGVD